MKLTTFLIALSLLVIGCGNNNENIIEESGIIESTNILLSSQVPGTVLEIIKDEGATVKKGDTLLVIDPEQLQIQLKQAKATVRIAQAQYSMLIKGAREEDIKLAEEQFNQAETALSQAKKDKERMENLLKTNAITEKQYEDVSNLYDITLSKYNSAKESLKKFRNFARPEEIIQASANLQRAEASMELIGKNLRDCYVVTPINGFIVKQFFEIGENVFPNSSLVKVSDLGLVNITIYVAETDIGKVKLNQKAEIFIDTFEDKIYEGKVTYISPEAEFTPKNIQTKDERTKLVFAVKIEVPNPNFELKSGLPADAIIYID